MRKVFFAACVALALFEFANVYFIMPMPGSQRMRSLELAYAIYQSRWWVRGALALVALAGLPTLAGATSRQQRLALAGAVLTVGVAWVVNVTMSADHMFLVPQRLAMVTPDRNTLPLERLVVGVAINGEARAYPLKFIGYHHQVPDTVGGQPVLVSYCTVCRTGRVFSPLLDGRVETFRLVGMDHFNAMLEDRTTGSWWRQANGEAVAGPRLGQVMREVPSMQVTLRQWLSLYPDSRIMQADSAALERYPKSDSMEIGASRSRLTGTDTASWGDKSWVVGIAVGGASRAYDWNRLKRERVVLDTLGGVPLLLALGRDTASFAAFRRPSSEARFAWRGDSLVDGDGRAYALHGRGPSGELPRVLASQEYWHSWRTFQPATTRW